jgi:hypothetical protein
MNYQEAERTAFLLADSLDEMATIVRDLSLTDEAQKLRDRATQLREDRFRVVVVGEFKRGKSTLLNAMLGDQVLPQRVTEATAIITLIQYGEKPEARIVFVDGRVDDLLSIEAFRQHYELNLEDTAYNENDRNEARDRFSVVDHAVLSYPVELCRHRVELVDSPGLGAHDVRTQRTRKFLPRADAVVFVLQATQFLAAEESHFLESILLPMGLRNVFFVINGWNLIDEAVLRPADADRERATLEERIQQRLTPFCVINGEDRSADRIFRVNALGALKARLGTPPDTAVLEASQVPAFEGALQRFLVQERGRARTDVILGTITTVQEAVNRFIATQMAMADKSIAEIEAEQAALQPKLDRLRGIRQHIIGFLDSQSATLQDRLVISFQHHMKRVEEDLPAVVENFDLSEITKGSMVWSSLTDWTRAEEDKLAKRVERCIQPQVQMLLEQRLAQWQQAIVRHEMQAIMIDIEKYLQEEAAEYQRVMQEIEQGFGLQGSSLRVDDLVKRWLGQNEYDKRSGTFTLAGVGIVGDMSWLIGSIAIDLAADALLHIAISWIPVVGIVITGIRLIWRENKLRAEMRTKVVDVIRTGLNNASQTESAKIHQRVKAGFDGLKSKVTSSIDEEIAVIDASLKAILEHKKEQAFSVEQEHARLEAARTAIATTIDHIHTMLATG